MAIQKNFNAEQPVVVSGVGKFFWYLSYCLLIPIFIGIGFKNQIKRYETKINEADSGIDVQLTQRQEMLTKLIDTTKQTMKWERETLAQLTALRSVQPKVLTPEQKAKFSDDLTTFHRNLNVQMEAYPNLKSIEAVQNLQNGIRDTEDNLAASRRLYNGNVSIYNQYIMVYPQSVIADRMQKTTKVFFEATAAQKADVKVDIVF